MSDKVFLDIVNMSITGSFAILIIILARLLLKKTPKVFSYALWFVAFFRLLVPVSFESVLSILPFNTTPLSTDMLYIETPYVETGIKAIDSVINPVVATEVFGSTANVYRIFTFWGKIIWFIGVFAFCLYSIYVMHCAIQLAFACCMRGGEVGGTQWERFSRSDQVLYIDRVIDRVDKKLIEKLPKMDILFRFPNLYPGTRTVIVLKQPKTEGSIRTVYIPETVAKKLEKLREMQMKLKLELGDDGYMDYGLIICQANGRPIMTEHLNKRFKEVLIGLNDPTINVDNVVFHSLRHTSTGVKLRLSKGDLKAVQGDGGWNSPDMVTKRYAHILDEDRRRLADEMEQSFYKGKAEEAPVAAAPALDAEALASLLASNPELLKKALESVQLANNT